MILLRGSFFFKTRPGPSLNYQESVFKCLIPYVFPTVVAFQQTFHNVPRDLCVLREFTSVNTSRERRSFRRTRLLTPTICLLSPSALYLLRARAATPVEKDAFSLLFSFAQRPYTLAALLPS